jgi:hypothetical protein
MVARKAPANPPPLVELVHQPDSLPEPEPSRGAQQFPTVSITPCCTLMSKNFSPFPRGTCILSIPQLIFSLGRYTPPVFSLRSQANLLFDDGDRPHSRGQGIWELTGVITLYAHVGPTNYPATKPPREKGKRHRLRPHLGRRRIRAPDSAVGCSRFVRNYSGNHSCFLFLRYLYA